MKKFIFGVLLSLSLCAPTFARAQNYWVPFVGGALFGYVVSRPPVVYYPQPIFMQPPPPQQIYIQPPVTYYQQTYPAPQCVLRSEIVNGQIVQGTYCY